MCALVLPLLLGCSGPVAVETPELDDDETAACAEVIDSLPDTLAEQERVEIEPADAPAAAYGDPAIVVRCGVEPPEDFDDFASCMVVSGVGWYITDERAVLDDESRSVTATTAGYEPRVEVVVPGDYRPAGLAAATAQLNPSVEQHTQLVQDCNVG